MTPHQPGATLEYRAKGLGWLALALWAVQAWRPQLSYPANGLTEAGLLLLFLLLSVLLKPAPPPLRSSVACLGFAFVLYCWARWVAAGVPAVGAENFGTLLETAIWAALTYNLARLQSEPRALMSAILVTVSALALLGGIHAVAQYLFLYDRHLAELKAAIGNAEPTPLQEGLMYHMQLKRVASIWGDPNAFGAFLALSLAASYRCASRFKQSAATGIVGSLAIPLALVGIALSGSRGAVIDAVLVSLICLWPVVRKRRDALALAVCSIWLLGAGQTMLTRSNTVRERINYAEVGLKIIARNPVFGSAPGAVDLLYGRYKPAEARESKYLHNWPLQLTAEYGLAGLGLALVFLLMLLWRGARSNLISNPDYLAVYAICAVFLVDALFELSFNHRELMALFGIATGVVLFMGAQSPQNPKRAWLGNAANLFFMLLTVAFVVPPLVASNQKDAAEDALQDNNSALARRHLRSAQQWTPRDPSIYLLLSQAEDMAGSTESSIMFLKSAISIQPESASLHAQLSRIEGKTGNLDDAERQARIAISLYPGNADYHYDLARLLEHRGNSTGALEEARLAAKNAYFNLTKYKAYVMELEKQAAGK